VVTDVIVNEILQSPNVPLLRKEQLKRSDRPPLMRMVFIVQSAIQTAGGPMNWPPESLVNEMVSRITSEPQRQRLESLPLDERRRTLMMWTGKGLYAQWVETISKLLPTPAQLTDTFEKLPGDRRLELMQLPPQELTRELLIAYVEQLQDDSQQALFRLGPQMRGMMEGMPWWGFRGRPPLGGFRGPRPNGGPGGPGFGPPPGDRGPGDRGEGERPRPPRGDGERRPVPPNERPPAGVDF
jgi:hypothetical protein